MTFEEALKTVAGLVEILGPTAAFEGILRSKKWTIKCLRLYGKEIAARENLEPTHGRADRATCLIRGIGTRMFYVEELIRASKQTVINQFIDLHPDEELVDLLREGCDGGDGELERFLPATLARQAEVRDVSYAPTLLLRGRVMWNVVMAGKS